MAVRRVRTDRTKRHSWAVWTVAWGGLFCAVTWLVEARLLAPLDAVGLGIIVDHRQLGLSGGMNWVFRMGFASVDATAALLWALWLSVRWKRICHGAGACPLPPAYNSDTAPRHEAPPFWKSVFPHWRQILGGVQVGALVPLLLFAIIVIQAGLRLVVDQPAPDRAYELQRAFAPEPVSAMLDRTDATARDAFEAATSAPETSNASAVTEERGSYPSGHAARTLFLALLAADFLRRAKPWGSRLGAVTGVGLFLLSGLVGYSALYFGYHWPSDLLGGYLLALAAYPAAARLLEAGRTA